MSEYNTKINEHCFSSVLITGGKGLIGRNLTSSLIASGYKVSHLSRGSASAGSINVFNWNPERQYIDPEALNGIDYIVHLAGANIGEKRWTEKRKLEIIQSRVDSAKFLHRIIIEQGIGLKAFISASATGIYGAVNSAKIFNETDPPAKDYLANVCRLWEEAADLFNNSGIRTVKIRTSVVLEKTDSALSKLMIPAKYGFLVQTGNGNQHMPWIHIRDLCKIYMKAIEDRGMNGSYNATAHQSVTHADFIKVLGHVIKKPVFPVPVPGFLLKMIMGEMAGIILTGSNVSSEKIINAGYQFIYSDLEEALKDILR
jgi:hypothetical protein